MPNTIVKQPQINFNSNASLPIVNGFEPYYQTDFGTAYLADSLAVMRAIPDNYANLVITSPPYALHFKKEYGNVSKIEYVDWFLEFAKEMQRILKDDGSFVLNLGASYNKGIPTHSLYHYKVLLALVEKINFHLAQEFFWYNPAKLPMPAEWVTVRRIRVKDSVEFIWWLSKSPFPKANNKNVLKAYSKDMIRLSKNGVKKAKRPSGHNIKDSFSQVEAGGSIPPNVFEDSLPENFLKFGNNAANDKYALSCIEAGIKRHPARFPDSLPEFFINLLTDPNDIVIDPFAGSNTTGSVSEKLQRRWIAIENIESYLKGSKFKF